MKPLPKQAIATVTALIMLGWSAIGNAAPVLLKTFNVNLGSAGSFTTQINPLSGTIVGTSFGVLFNNFVGNVSDVPPGPDQCLGCELFLAPGQTGTFDFQASDFPNIVNLLTNGINDEILDQRIWKTTSNIFGGHHIIPSGGGGNLESFAINGSPDLIGRQIDFFRLVVFTNDPLISCTDAAGDIGMCDIHDYAWKVFGEGTPIGSGAATPEPGTITLVVIGLVGFVFLRRKTLFP